MGGVGGGLTSQGKSPEGKAGKGWCDPESHDTFNAYDILSSDLQKLRLEKVCMVLVNRRWPSESNLWPPQELMRFFLPK